MDRDPALKRELRRFAPENLKEVRKHEFPLLAALGYAVMSFEVSKHRPDEDRKAEVAAETLYENFEP